MALDIRLLADCPQALGELEQWFLAEWPGWYGAGGQGDARADLAAYAGRDGLPVGVLAFLDGELAGIAALKASSIDVRPDWGPWAGAGLVRPDLRRRGIGAALLQALEGEARRLGHAAIYCGTATSASLMERAGWQWLETIPYHGADVALYRKALDP